MEINFPKLEKKILKFWKEERIFEKSIGQRHKASGFVFYEGPPTANAKAGLHHVLARVFKDIICRYKTMQGFRVERKAGWDTHGLPVELEIEKKLGLKNKKDIEKYGIAKFNKKCKESVWTYKKDWEKLTERIGFWLDMENPYITYDSKYIETLWQIIKKIWEEKLLSQDFKVVPYCPRCGTSLSSHEVAQGYKKIKEPSVFFKLKIRSPEFRGSSLLVWTTTPWTLPGNVAVAINEKFVYCKVQNPQLKAQNEYLILAKERLKIFGEGYEIIEEFKGERLLGLQYQPVFDFYTPDYKKERIWEVIGADFVSLDDGTGLVHIAPAFGEEDMEAIKTQNSKTELPLVEAKVKKRTSSSSPVKNQNETEFPILLTVNEDGKFTLDVKSWAGMFVKEADPLIVEDLKSRGILFKEEMYEHDYPFCWRCRSPLLYYAKKSWFIRTTKVKSDLIKNNGKINWFPGYLKEGRFGEWLKEVKDWALSRERYWGTPLPIWRCATCQDSEIIGSLDDLMAQKFSKNNYFILRHGESLANKKNLATSFPEKIYSPLTPRGEKQIKAAAQKLKKEKIDLIFSSDLLRTKQTSQIVGEALGIKPKLDKRLRDNDVGVFNGRPIKEVGKFWTAKDELSPLEYYSRRWLISAPGGENYRDVEKRMWSFVKETDKKYQGKNILIVGHKRPFALLEKVLLGKEMAAVVKDIVGEKEMKTGELKKIEFKSLPYDENMEIDLHRPQVDEIKFFCRKCGGLMSRVPEVIDCWFDSGSMPFAQAHWPFKESEKRKTKSAKLKPPELFPADYICEGIDQTRGWFYTLLAVSTSLGFGHSYKNVISLGHVLDEKGEKMSKSRGNAVDPWYVVEKYGSDAVRWYFYTINQPGEPKLFSEKDIAESLRKFILTIWNCFVFYETYAPKKQFSIFNFQFSKTKNILDRWIVSKLNKLIAETADSLDNYDVTGAARTIEKFAVEDLSLWYVRRSRRRFQKPKTKKGLAEASETLGFVLLTLSKLAAPFIPFLSEDIYTKIQNTKYKIQSSVHLEDWPKANKKLIDENLNQSMEEVRKIVALALAERAKAGIKVRQPLAKLKMKNEKLKIGGELLGLIKDEINVKEVVFNANIEKEAELDTKITPELEEEGIIREIIRNIQEMRKDAGLKPKDKILVKYFCQSDLGLMLSRNKDILLGEAKIKDLTVKGKEEKGFNAEKETKVGNNKLWLGIKKF